MPDSASEHTSEMRYRAIYDRAFLFIGLLDIDGNIFDANRTALEFAGVELADLLGTPFVATPWWQHCASSRMRLSQAIEDCQRGRFSRFDAVHVGSRGQRIVVDFTQTPIFDDGGRVVQMQPEGRDITETKRLAAELLREKERLRLANEAGGIGSFTVDIDRGVAQYTPELAAMLGFPGVAEVPVEAALARVHRDDAGRVRAEYEAATHPGGSGRMKTEMRFVLPGGTVRWMWFNGEVKYRGSGAGRQPVEMIGACADISDRKSAELALRDSEHRLRTILGHQLNFSALLTPAGHVLEISESSLKATGAERAGVIGTEFFSAPWWKRFPTVVAKLREQVARVVSGRWSSAAEVVYEGADGSTRHVLNAVTGVRDHAGVLQYLLVEGVDITERRKAEDHVRLLMREVTHRSKNLLSLVQAMARQTIADDVETFQESFSARLQALAASQELLVGAGWRGTDLGALVQTQLELFVDLIGTRIRVGGPAVHVSAHAAQPIAMAIYELATNAVKYGALSNETGYVTILWRLDADRAGDSTCEIVWQEHDGPTVVPPTRRGFGSVVIEQAVRSALGADVELSYLPSGCVWRLSCPLRALEEQGK